jgi:HK97 family phage portal protein
MQMSLITEVKKFFGFGRESGALSLRTTQIVGALSPFIGLDNKTRYIEDVERVKYAYAVISWIAKKAAEVPVLLFKHMAEGKELVLDNQFYKLLQKPNDYQGSFEFTYQAFGYYLSTGALYIYKERLSSGRIMAMHVLPSDMIEPIYRESFRGPVGFLSVTTGKVIPVEDVFYMFNPQFKYEQLGVGEQGYSPMKSLLTILQKTADIDKADLASIQNMGVAGILTDKTADPWTAEQAAIIEKNLRAKAYGPDNKGKFLITSGDISFIPIGLSPIDLNLFESDKKVLEDICIVYHVPYMIFRQDNTNQSFGTAMREARAAAYTDAILPLVNAFVSAWNSYDLSAYGQNLQLHVDTSGIKELQEDEKSKAETLAVQWWKPIDQKQRESGMEVDQQLVGKYLIPQSLVMLDELSFDLQMQRIEGEINQMEKRLFAK